MKFFVSSRMKELFIERKTAIEVIHFSGHTPLYIEREPEVKGEGARDTMLNLLKDADGLLSIHYLSEGRRETILDNHTPIEYELIHFLTLHKGAPILLFRQEPDQFVNPSKAMVQWFEDIAEEMNLRIITFQGPEQLDSKLRAALKHHKKKIDVSTVSTRLVLRYVGPDFIGLVGKISEIVFTKYKLNIDYISHAARGGRATVCISCSPREFPRNPELIDIGSLRTDLLEGIEQDLTEAESDDRLVDGSQPSIVPDIVVDIDTTQAKPFQFFVEVRTIDAPGQLNAICKALRELRFNIDELQLRPTPPEYPRQTTIVLWLSKHHTRRQDLDKEVGLIEAGLQYLVGIRTFSVKAIMHDGRL